MNAPEAFVKNVSLGLVLDAKGKWVPLAQPLAVERSVLRHLAEGEVLHDGKWMAIATCLATRSNASSGDAGNPDVDAEHIANKKGIPWVVVSCNTGEQHLAPTSLTPLIRQSGASVDGDESDPWETSKGLPLYVKTIALVAAGLVAVAAIIFVIVKVFF